MIFISSITDAAKKLVLNGYTVSFFSIRKFQKEHNIPATGILDPLTVYFINHEL